MIRKAKLCDIPDLVMLNSQVHNVHVNLFPEVFKTGDVCLTEKIFSNLLASDDYCILIARKKNVTTGYLMLKKLIKPENAFKKETGCAYIDQVCVHIDYRREGIFKDLLDKACEEAALWGMSRLELDVWTENSSAVEAYEKSGFRTFNQKMFISLDQ